MRIYISGAFAGSNNIDLATERYTFLGSALEDLGHEAYLPHFHTGPTQSSGLSPQFVYKTDIAEIRKCDALVAVLDEPSHGVGAEITIALNDGKITIGIHHEENSFSRLIEGMLASSERGLCLSYASFADVAPRIERQIAAWETGKTASGRRKRPTRCISLEPQPSPLLTE